MRVLFAHGLWSSPGGSKPNYLKEVCKWDVFACDMRRYGWSIKDQERAIVDSIEEEGPFEVLIGSSFGALAIANAASRMDGLDLRLVLLAPAFGVYDTLSGSVGPEEMDRWKENGHRTFQPPDWEDEVILEWSFMQDAIEMGWPEIRHRTVIIHGINDEVVPIDNSREVASSNPEVELIEVVDGHRLADSLDIVPGAVEMCLSG